MKNQTEHQTKAEYHGSTSSMESAHHDVMPPTDVNQTEHMGQDCGQASYGVAESNYAAQNASGYMQQSNEYQSSNNHEYVSASHATGGYNEYNSGYAANEMSAQSSSQIQEDPNPIILKKKFPGPCAKHVQKICVRYLQPPPPPPPGPLIIKEIRAPQPPSPPPLCLKQRMPPIQKQPPIILREKPPARPPQEPSKVVCKKLPPPPPSKRRVIIERLPKPQPPPRDVIIERWLPYQKPLKRKVIYQRAPPMPLRKQQKNVIVVYEGCNQVERVFRKLGITNADPESYVQQYGHSLLDKYSLESKAKQVGVHEDLSPPAIGHEQYPQLQDGHHYDGSSGHEQYLQNGNYGGSTGYEQFTQDGQYGGDASGLYGAGASGYYSGGASSGHYGGGVSGHYGGGASGHYGAGASGHYGAGASGHYGAGASGHYGAGAQYDTGMEHYGQHQSEGYISSCQQNSYGEFNDMTSYQADSGYHDAYNSPNAGMSSSSNYFATSDLGKFPEQSGNFQSSAC